MSLLYTINDTMVSVIHRYTLVVSSKVAHTGY